MPSREEDAVKAAGTQRNVYMNPNGVNKVVSTSTAMELPKSESEKKAQTLLQVTPQPN
jgi:hypothetical protein